MQCVTNVGGANLRRESSEVSETSLSRWECKFQIKKKEIKKSPSQIIYQQQLLCIEPVLCITFLHVLPCLVLTTSIWSIILPLQIRKQGYKGYIFWPMSHNYSVAGSVLKPSSCYYKRAMDHEKMSKASIILFIWNHHMYIYIHMYTCIHIYMYICIHTYIYT